MIPGTTATFTHLSALTYSLYQVICCLPLLLSFLPAFFTCFLHYLASLSRLQLLQRQRLSTLLLLSILLLLLLLSTTLVFWFFFVLLAAPSEQEYGLPHQTNILLAPAKVLRDIVENFVRNAHHTLDINVYKLECWYVGLGSQPWLYNSFPFRILCVCSFGCMFDRCCCACMCVFTSLLDCWLLIDTLHPSFWCSSPLSLSAFFFSFCSLFFNQKPTPDRHVNCQFLFCQTQGTDWSNLINQNTQTGQLRLLWKTKPLFDLSLSPSP